MTFQRQEATPAETALAWHQQQLREVPLTAEEREFHWDMIRWLEQHLAEGKMAPHGRQPRAVRKRGKSAVRQLINWLIPAGI